ncbi:MAG: riboflavin synthase [Sedimentisphaerales bacterium]
MFTGLIETVCKVGSSVNRTGGIRLTINLGCDVKCGDSVAVNGVCLTVAGLKGTATEFDVSAETLSKTTLGKLKAGSEVNIERAMSASDRFGGHFVQGHIDTIGKVKKIEKKGDFWVYAFEVGKEISDFLVPKGSIAVDGVSLTIVDAQGQNFSVAVIPATFQNTIFKNYKAGDMVNVETDIICRMVKKQLDQVMGQKQGLTVEKLKEMGF